MKMHALAFALAFALALAVSLHPVHAYGANSSSYSVHMFAMGLQASGNTSGNFTTETFLNFNPSMTGNASSQNYTANIGPIGLFIGGPNATLPYCGDGACSNGEDCSSCAADCGSCPATPPGGGGASAEIPAAQNKTVVPAMPECRRDANCGYQKYCFNGTCRNASCYDDSDCPADQHCYNWRCVQLFDLKIINFLSPAKIGDYFEFTYYVKAMSNVSNDVKVDFWIEKGGNRVSSGSDVIYIGNFEEKTEKSKLYLPEDLESGQYDFYVELNYGTYKVDTHRTITITVQEGGVVTIEETNVLADLMPYLLIVLIALVLIVIVLIYVLEKRRERREKELPFHVLRTIFPAVHKKRRRRKGWWARIIRKRRRKWWQRIGRKKQRMILNFG